MSTTIEQIAESPKEILLNFYDHLYRGRSKSDSPDMSRISLLRRMHPILSTLDPDARVLDLGSGKQIMERQYRAAYGNPNCSIVTVDFSKIHKQQLLMRNTRDITHIQADGDELPFLDGVFMGVLSNMALDFMSRNAIKELHRVMSPNSHGFINLHHPSLIPDDLDDLLAKPHNSTAEQQIYTFWDFLRRNNMLTDNSNEISDRFTAAGFVLTNSVRLGEDTTDKWWEVDMIKPR